MPRYRHFAYEWLGVNKVELAVMAELLLRGSQTEGELRGRAARMEPIADVAALRPVLDSLTAKRLVVSLTPQGRGHVVTHNLYEPQEMEKQRTLHQDGGGEGAARYGVYCRVVPARPTETYVPTAGPDARSLQQELDTLRNEIAQLKTDLAELNAAYRRTTDELHSIRADLGRE